jgi:hypothetical protein
MKKYIRTAALLGAMCFALMPTAPAYAANWVYVTKSTKNAVFYYDSDTIQRAGNQVTVWVKLDHSRDKTEKAREKKVLYRYDCVNRTLTILQVTIYYPNGKNETLALDTYQQNEIAVTPDTVSEAMLEAVCGLN